jgi:hypothetical protein
MQLTTLTSILQIILIVIFSLITFYFQSQMIILKSDKKVSSNLKLNMVMWMITSLACVFYNGYFLLFFKGEGKIFLYFY